MKYARSIANLVKRRFASIPLQKTNSIQVQSTFANTRFEKSDMEAVWSDFQQCSLKNEHINNQWSFVLERIKSNIIPAKDTCVFLEWILSQGRLEELESRMISTLYFHYIKKNDFPSFSKLTNELILNENGFFENRKAHEIVNRTIHHIYHLMTTNPKMKMDDTKNILKTLIDLAIHYKMRLCSDTFGPLFRLSRDYGLLDYDCLDELLTMSIENHQNIPIKAILQPVIWFTSVGHVNISRALKWNIAALDCVSVTQLPTNQMKMIDSFLMFCNLRLLTLLTRSRDKYQTSLLLSKLELYLRTRPYESESDYKIYSQLIHAYSSVANLSKSLEIYSQLEKLVKKPNHLKQVQQISLASLFHEISKSKPLDFAEFLYSGLLQTYAHQHKIEFRNVEIPAQVKYWIVQLAPLGNVPLSTSFFNSMLKYYCQQRNGTSKFDKVIYDMNLLGFQKDLITVSILMNGNLKTENSIQAANEFLKTPNEALSKNTKVHSSINNISFPYLKTLSQSPGFNEQLLNEAIDVITAGEDIEKVFNKRTMTLLMELYAKLLNFEKMLDVWKRMRKAVVSTTSSSRKMDHLRAVSDQNLDRFSIDNALMIVLMNGFEMWMAGASETPELQRKIVYRLLIEIKKVVTLRKLVILDQGSWCKYLKLCMDFEFPAQGIFLLDSLTSELIRISNGPISSDVQNYIVSSLKQLPVNDIKLLLKTVDPEKDGLPLDAIRNKIKKLSERTRTDFCLI